jgi:hypothetical protein
MSSYLNAPTTLLCDQWCEWPKQHTECFLQFLFLGEAKAKLLVGCPTKDLKQVNAAEGKAATGEIDGRLGRRWSESARHAPITTCRGEHQLAHG